MPPQPVHSLGSASLRTSGKQLKPCAFDAQIAATALSLELPLYTANPQDVPEVDGLEIVSLASPEAP